MVDSSLPQFWDTRYETDVTPWDAGRVPQALRAHAPAFRSGARILIPACGSAYELNFLLENGFDAMRGGSRSARWWMMEEIARRL